MIDKFTENLVGGKEDEQLSYMMELASDLFQDFDYDEDGNMFFFPNLDLICTFKKRYNTSLKNLFSYNEYLNNQDLEIKETLLGLDLDPEKFWYLLLFIYDFSQSSCTNAYSVSESPKEQMDKLINAIDKHTHKFDNNRKFTFDKDISLTLKIEGKHNIIIDDLTALYHIAYFCKEGLSKVDSSTSMFLFGSIITGNKNGPEKHSVLIYFFAKQFLSFFEKHSLKTIRKKKDSLVSLNKKLLISKLIYFTGISKNTSFKDSDDTLKGFLNQYKDKDLKMISKIYY